MPRGPKGFSQTELDGIKEKLRTACEKSWSAHGYKKTNVGELCQKAGISIGTFYLCYAAKEYLFLETLEGLQNKLMAMMRDAISRNPSKEGLTEAIKLLYREYDNNGFLYRGASPDFLAFINKLPHDKVSGLRLDNEQYFKDCLAGAGVRLQIGETFAFSVISALLSVLNLKDVLKVNHVELFDYMLEQMLDKLVE